MFRVMFDDRVLLLNWYSQCSVECIYAAGIPEAKSPSHQIGCMVPFPPAARFRKWFLYLLQIRIQLSFKGLDFLFFLHYSMLDYATFLLNHTTCICLVCRCVLRSLIGWKCDCSVCLLNLEILCLKETVG